MHSVYTDIRRFFRRKKVREEIKSWLDTFLAVFIPSLIVVIQTIPDAENVGWGAVFSALLATLRSSIKVFTTMKLKDWVERHDLTK